MSKLLVGNIYGMPAHFGARVGFIKSSISEVSACLFEWRSELGFEPSSNLMQGGVRTTAGSILPLEGPPSFRDLLIQTTGDWVAYFNANDEPRGPISVLSRRLKADALWVTARPFLTKELSDNAPYGGYIFCYMQGKADIERSIALIEGDSLSSRYTFQLGGPVQPWEDVDRYTERLKRNRFDSDLIEKYCRELGVDPFNLDFYSGPSVLIERTKFD